MLSVVGGTTQDTSAALWGTMSTNKKSADTKHDLLAKQAMTNDIGVKQGNTDEWLSATTPERQGPALLGDNFGREKVHLSIRDVKKYSITPLCFNLLY
jgi:catalase